ncbi:hypothetical protein ES703_101029 [subsurface metagenome]
MDNRQGDLNAGRGFDPIYSDKYIEGGLYRVALVQQPGLWQCLCYHPEDQGASLLLCGYHLLHLVLRELGAGYTPGTQKWSTLLALGYSAPATADTQVERYPGNGTAQPDIWSGGPGQLAGCASVLQRAALWHR